MNKKCTYCGVQANSLCHLEGDEGESVSLCPRCMALSDTGGIKVKGTGKQHSKDFGMVNKFKLRKCLKCESPFSSKNDYRICYRCKTNMRSAGIYEGSSYRFYIDID